MTYAEVKMVLDRVQAWPAERQAALARIALHIEAQDFAAVQEDEATKKAIREGLAQARRGEFATDEDVEAAYARFRS